MRLMDKNDFLDLFYVASAGQDKLFIAAVEMVVEDTPTIDAVPVVRCRECKHKSDPMRCPMCFEELIDLSDGDWDYNILDYAKDDGFCHEGERKDGEG